MLKWMHNKQCMKSQTLQSQLDCQLKRPISEKQKVELKWNAMLSYTSASVQRTCGLWSMDMHSKFFSAWELLSSMLSPNVLSMSTLKFMFSIWNMYAFHSYALSMNVRSTGMLTSRPNWILKWSEFYLKRFRNFHPKREPFLFVFGQSPSVKFPKI